MTILKRLKNFHRHCFAAIEIPWPTFLTGKMGQLEHYSHLTSTGYCVKIKLHRSGNSIMKKKINHIFYRVSICVFILFLSSALPANVSNSNNNDESKDKILFNANETLPEQYKLAQVSQYLRQLYIPPYLNFNYFPKMPLEMNRFIDGSRFRPLNPKKRFGRLMLETAAHFAYATTSYWVRLEVMKEDWEYHFNWKDQTRRFFFRDGFRFDSNVFSFNWTHSMAGALYYQYARANNYKPLGSFLFTIGASYIWEFLVEFREVISINDMIGTSFGGLSIGESLYQLGRFFRSKRPTILNRAMRVLSNPVLSINELLDGKKGRNQYIFTDSYWNECYFSLGPRFDTFEKQESNTLMNIAVDTQIIHIPGYGNPGIVDKGYKKTIFTEFNLNGAWSRKGIYDYTIFAKSTLFGHFWQNIHSPSTDKTHRSGDTETVSTGQESYRGYSLFIGGSSAFDLYNNNTDKLSTKFTPSPSSPGNTPGRTDRYTIINLFGPTVDFAYYNNNFKARLTTDIYGDFALIHSLPFTQYKKLYTFGQTKWTLQEHGYYYALGVTLSTMLQLNYSNLELKGKLKYHYFDSVEGMDRFQKDVKPEDDFDLKDRVSYLDITLGYRIPNTDIQLSLGFEQKNRWGEIDSFFSQKIKERRSYFQIRYIF